MENIETSKDKKERMEKECEICGIWFTPSRNNQKYCPECRNHSEQKRRTLKRNIRKSIQRCGTGRKLEQYENISKNYEILLL